MATDDKTLINQLYRYSFSKKLRIHPNMGFLQRCLLEARRFVLDDRMSSFLADLALATFLPKNKKIIAFHMKSEANAHIFPGSNLSCKLAEQIRISARLPHRITWVEYDPRLMRERYCKLAEMGQERSENEDSRAGWLLEQHPNINTAFTAHMFMLNPEQLTIDPWMLHWMTDDQPLPFKNTWLPDSVRIANPIPGLKNQLTASELLVGLLGYRSSQVTADKSIFYRGVDISKDLEISMFKTILDDIGSLRIIWALLATINDIPVFIDEIRTSKGFVAHGYRRFLDYHTITLNVPTKKDMHVLARKVVAAARRRLHMVRGHWRINWRHPPNPLCSHDYNADNECNLCHGYRLWIHEHERGDASLGIVLTDYAVKH
jgi:hypothetical protein